MSQDHLYLRRLWSDLAPELLELILQRLSLMDYLKCREVCSSWRSAVDDALAKKGRCPPAPQIPFLLLLPVVPNSHANLVSLNEHKGYTMPTETWEGSINGVHALEGWLMFQRPLRHRMLGYTYMEFFFFNPVSGDKFQFPNLPLFSNGDFRRRTSHSSRTVFSSAPGSPEFIVTFSMMISHEGRWKQQLAFCKATDKSWTLINTVESQTMLFREIALRGCKLYASTLDVLNFVIVFNLEDANAITAERLVMLDPKPSKSLGHFKVKNGLHRIKDKDKCMLVKDSTCGEFLLVIHRRDKIENRHNGEHVICTKGFRIFKLDMSGPRWLEVDNLGDRSLLLDSTGIRVISAADLNGTGQFIGANCVLFCNANTLRIDSYPKRDLGVFHLADKSIKRFALRWSLLFAKRNLWFTPSSW